MGFDPFLIIVAAALALFVFMQFRTAKKRRSAAADLQEKMVPGTDIMTNYGLYGTILSIDDETNEALIETTPGTVLRIHRQTILKAVDDEISETTETVPDDAAELESDFVADEELETSVLDEQPEPEFGERVAEIKKPARKNAKKGDE